MLFKLTDAEKDCNVTGNGPSSGLSLLFPAIANSLNYDKIDLYAVGLVLSPEPGR